MSTKFFFIFSIEHVLTFKKFVTFNTIHLWFLLTNGDKTLKKSGTQIKDYSEANMMTILAV